MEQKKKKKVNWQQVLTFLLMGLLGVVGGIVMVNYLNTLDADSSTYQPLLSLLVLLVGFYAAMFLHLILHEAGHLLFGLLTGYRFSSFRILSFMWVKNTDGKIALKRLSLAGTGGQCLMAPPPLQDGKMPLALYNLGGSLVNMIVGAVFLGLFFLFPTVPFLSVLLLAMAVVGFLLAVTNGIPMRTGTVDNDGYNAFALSKDPAATEALWVQLMVSDQSVKGVRLKDMPSEWFTVPSDEAMKNSLVAGRGVMACNRLMDEEKFGEADDLMAHILTIDSGMVGLHRNLLVCDRMYVELIGENRADVTAAMLSKEQKRFMKAMSSFPSVQRTAYALALLYERDAAKAERVLTQFEKSAKTYPYTQDVVAERHLIALAQQKVG